MDPNINVTVALMQEDIKHTKETIDRVEGKLDAFIEASEKHFAAKWVEKTLAWFLFTIAALCIAYLFARLVGATFTKFP